MKTRTLTSSTAASAQAIFGEVLSGAGVAHRFLLEDRPMVCGSDPAVDLVITESTVSRRHARIEPTRRGVRVEDLGSRNGTWYLGASVKEALVPFGSTVRLGKALIRFVAQEPGEPTAIAGLEGSSIAMRQLRENLHRAAKGDVAVLLRGETGSGKETAARALHALSARKGGPFAIFEGGHVSHELLESHLFGHRRGAFTGASEARIGIVEQAHRGTLFLDEVGELTPEAQLRLLRVLERRTFTRLGENTERSSDFRLICATQHDLEARVRERKLREDLFFRIAVVVIDVPPLRRREGDLELLAEHFARERGVTLDGATLAAWKAREWRGNVRELRNAVEQYEAGTVSGTSPAVSRAEVLGEVERSLVLEALEAHDWDVARAAQQLTMSRSQLYRVMKRFGISPRRR
ncbi:MAG: sigma 54-dependent Fis family transcriptional regulator [Archangium sp.]|nr:sigma 54-dependent Fis family transcriptional regulator [Archangium sp.]